MLVYTEHITERFRWIVNLIFEGILNLKFDITEDKSVLIKHNAPAINYSNDSQLPGIHINPHGLLFESAIKSIDIKVEVQEFPIFFGNDSDLGFDLFSAAFFLASRYEEYLPFKNDMHGRFAATESCAFKNNFLQQPIIDIWANHLKSELMMEYPDMKFPEKKFRFINTYDIDVAYAFKGRSIAREFRSKVKDWLYRDVERISERKIVLKGIKADPYDTYDYQNEWKAKLNLETRYFILVAPYGSYDKNITLESNPMRELLKSIASQNEIGLHPSYKTRKDIDKMRNEKMRLEEILGKTITKSRQHFLRFTLPDTYGALEKIGILEEYSMGFADHVGFRAGTSNPFFFFDLVRNESTKLKLFPVSVMDSSLKSYMGLNPKKAVDLVSGMIREVKKVNGTFISIWHNHTISDYGEWKGWRWVFESMLNETVVNVQKS